MHDYARQMQILTENIYGVDKDEQAVEVAQLNLLLKGLHLRDKLPKLENIRQGDSLISGSAAELEKFFGAKWKEKNPFNWDEQFKKVMADGGFDVIVGNPPYVRGRSLEQKSKDFWTRCFETFTPNSDIYVAFLERALGLLREGGLMGFIIPHSYLTEGYAQASRIKLLQAAQILEIVDFRGIKVFEDATVSNIILIVRKKTDSNYSIAVKRWQEDKTSRLSPASALQLSDSSIRLELLGENQFIVENVGKQSLLLGNLCYVSYSVAAHSEVEKKKKDAYIFNRKVNKKSKPFIEAREISRYSIDYHGRWLQYDPKVVRRPGLPELFETSKIMVRDVVGNRGLICALDETGLYADYSVVCLTLKSNLQKVKSRKLEWTDDEIKASKRYSLFFLLGLLNSALLNFVFRTAIGGGLHVYPDNLRRLPIRRINFDDATEKQQHDRIVALVEEMLGLQKEYAEAAREKLPRADALKRHIDDVDAEIDALVYELYGLTEEEIEVVKKA